MMERELCEFFSIEDSLGIGIPYQDKGEEYWDKLATQAEKDGYLKLVNTINLRNGGKRYIYRLTDLGQQMMALYRL
jgi:hypothetical protein